MKVSDLRVGNIVLYKQDNDELPVLKIDGDKKTVCLDLLLGLNMELNEQDIEPIPLTPEWLERCGFEKVKEDDSNSYLSYSILKLDGVIAKQKDGWYQMITDLDGYHEQNVGVKLEFVHQLQNRYLSLTGEELNVKL